MKTTRRIDINTGSVKHVPQRTCISCRQVKAKRELVRIVKTSTGLMVDAKGKEPGRGAYLCKTRECWENALKGQRLEYIMRMAVTPQDRRNLEEYLQKL